MKLKLFEGIEIDGEVVTELDLNLGSLTGNDCISAQMDIMADGTVPLHLDIDKRYQAALAAKALKVPPEDVNELSLRDFTAITLAVRAFLLGISEEET